jgi:hypothetical protein
MLAVQGADALNFGAAGEAFLILPVSALLVFAVLVIAAIINVRRAEWHKVSCCRRRPSADL